MRNLRSTAALWALASLAMHACGDNGHPSSPDSRAPDGAPDAGPVPDAPPPAIGDPAAGGWRRFALPGVSGTSPVPYLGAAGQVDDVAIAPDGTVYLAGSFGDAAGLAANNVVAWNGNDYQALGTGLEGRIPALAIDEAGTLWAVGSVDVAGNVTSQLYRWTGTTWQAIGGVLDHEVFDLQSIGGDLFVVGTFLNAGNVSAARLARFDGAAWHPVLSDLSNGAITAFAPTATGYCIAGELSALGSVEVDNAACWDGATWQPLGTGMPARASVLARSPDGTWYAGAPSAQGIYRLGASGRWTALEYGVSNGRKNDVRDIAFVGDDIVIGGDFNFAGREVVQTPNLARWSPTTGWSTYGSGVSGRAGSTDPNVGVHALAVAPDGTLWVGGAFHHSGSQAAVNVVRIASTGEVHAVVGPRAVNGVSAHVRALASLPDGTLIASGQLRFGDDGVADHLAIFNGTTWTDVPGLAAQIHDVLVRHDGSIAVAGQLGNAAGERSAVAIWSQGAWTLFGGAVEGSGDVLFEDSQHRLWFALDVWDQPTKLLVLDGDTWTERGRFAGGISALAEWNGRIVVGGAFQTVDGKAIANLAIEDGAGGWTSLGGGSIGAGHQISALATSASLGLLVGGTFDRIGDTPVNNLAAWDGSQWRDLAGGVTATNWAVMSMQAHDGGVFVAGAFARAGSVAAAGIAWFDGTTWHAMDGGVDSAVLTMALHDDVLYLGGTFVEVGGQTSARIAAWDFAPR
jgi:hypothetical protein